MLKKFIIKSFFYFKKKIFDYFYLFNLDFIKFNSFIKKNSYHVDKENNSIFLFDSFEVLENTCFRLLYLPIISKFYKSNLLYFNVNSIIFKKLYNSINANKLNIRLSKSQIAERDLKIKYFFKNTKSRADLLNYSINKLNIGLDIYESYLIRCKKPTIENINIENKNLKKVVEEAFSLLIFWDNFFKINKVSGILLSHRNYIETNILNRIAIERGIPVYSLSGEGHKINRWKDLCLNFFATYNEIFIKLSEVEKKEGFNFSKKQLEKRFSGEVGVDMAYSKKSAFGKSSKTMTEIKNKKPSIIICTACFYDNPHAYGKMMFSDFYEMMEFLASISHELDYNWFIKPHPDYLPGTIEIIEELCKKFKSIQLVDPDIRFNEISKQVKIAITPYGSVGHELPLVGMNVINCSSINPHIAFNFNFTPKNKDELKNKILNLNFEDFLVEDIYKFYYVHYKFLNKSNLINYDDFLNLKNSFNKNIMKTFNEFISKENFNLLKIEKRIFEFLSKDQFTTADSQTLKLLSTIEDKNFK
jgi:hypothetical protein